VKNQTQSPTSWRLYLIFLFVLVGLMAGCSGGTPQATPNATTPAPESVVSNTPLPTDTAAPPSATPEPLAVSVNGEGISLAAYDAELARYQAAYPEQEIGAAERQQVLDNLVDTLLLAQAARANGYELSPAELDERINQLVGQAGGQENFQRWLDENLYDPDTFRHALALYAEAAWYRDQLIASVPGTAEQVRARQIFLYNSEDAKNVLERLNAGTNFVTIATETDPVAAGELGWFPRGYLLEPEIEAAAFNLQPGEYSDVIETRLGFHIIQVIERQTDRPLDPDARRALQRKAVMDWLQTQRESSTIEIFGG
jgi:peptidyl-prolyl cis-trans isomerase C